MPATAGGRPAHFDAVMTRELLKLTVIGSPSTKILWFAWWDVLIVFRKTRDAGIAEVTRALQAQDASRRPARPSARAGRGWSGPARPRMSRCLGSAVPGHRDTAPGATGAEHRPPTPGPGRPNLDQTGLIGTVLPRLKATERHGEADLISTRGKVR
jgi:hypothetical protein